MLPFNVLLIVIDMVTKRSFFNILFLFLSYPASAADTLTAINPDPIQFKGIYNFELSGVPLGKLGIEVQQTKRDYTIVSDVVTSGLVKLFVKHSSHTMVDATGSQDFAYTEATYESHYQTRNKKKYVKMLTKDGITGDETLVPPDNPLTRPKVTADLKKDVVDPLSLTLRMRSELWKAQQNHTPQFTIRMYDGRRLSEIHFVVGEKKTLRYNDGKVPVIMVSVSRKMIAGFTKTELEDFDPKEPELRLYFTDDARLLPLRAEFTLMFGTASATLAKECLANESCLFGLKE